MMLKYLKNGKLDPRSVVNADFALTGLFPESLPAGDDSSILDEIEITYGFRPWREALAIARARVTERRRRR